MDISLYSQSVSGNGINSLSYLTPQEVAVIDDMKEILQVMENIQNAGSSNISITSARELCIDIQKLYKDMGALPSPPSPDDAKMIATAKSLFEGAYSPYNLADAAKLYNPLEPNDVQPMEEAMKTFITNGWLGEEIDTMQQFITNPFQPPS